MAFGFGFFVKMGSKLFKWGVSEHRLKTLISSAKADLDKPLLTSFSGADRFNAATTLLDATLIRRLRSADDGATRVKGIETYLQRFHEEYQMAKPELSSLPATRAEVIAVALIVREMSFALDREIAAFRSEGATLTTAQRATFDEVVDSMKRNVDEAFRLSAARSEERALEASGKQLEASVARLEAQLHALARAEGDSNAKQLAEHVVQLRSELTRRTETIAASLDAGIQRHQLDLDKHQTETASEIAAIRHEIAEYMQAVEQSGAEQQAQFDVHRAAVAEEAAAIRHEHEERLRSIEVSVKKSDETQRAQLDAHQAAVAHDVAGIRREYAEHVQTTKAALEKAKDTQQAQFEAHRVAIGEEIAENARALAGLLAQSDQAQQARLLRALDSFEEHKQVMRARIAEADQEQTTRLRAHAESVHDALAASEAARELQQRTTAALFDEVRRSHARDLAAMQTAARGELAAHQNAVAAEFQFLRARLASQQRLIVIAMVVAGVALFT